MKEITLPWPAPELSSNSRAHYMAKVRATKEARNLAWAVAMEAPRIQKMENARIFVEFYPPTRRGDVHNVPSALKAYIDGIADAMGCDDKGFAVDFPTQWAGSGKPGKVVFRVEQPDAMLTLADVVNRDNWKSIGDLASDMVRGQIE